MEQNVKPMQVVVRDRGLDWPRPKLGVLLKHVGEPGSQSVVSDNSSSVGQECLKAIGFPRFGRQAPEPRQEWQVEPAHDIAKVR
jgi:hypothetical protein